MGLGLLFGLGSALYHVLSAVFGDFGGNDWRDFWIMAGGILVAAIVLGLAARISVFFPRLLLGFCMTATPGAFAAAVISLFTGQGKFAIPLFVFTATSIAAFVICNRIVQPVQARLAYESMQQVMAVERARLRAQEQAPVCRKCGHPLDDRSARCPECGTPIRARRPSSEV